MKNIDSMKYDVFISYSRKDYIDAEGNVIEGNIISKIKETLKSNGYTYWFDEAGIYSGDEFVGIITEAIQNSEVFLFVSSVNSNKSDWTNHEIAVAKLLKKKTIPFKVDNAIYNTSILMYLAPLDFIDYQKNPGKAFDALVASLKNHSAKLNELKRRQQEEETRKQKELEAAEAKLKAEEAKNMRIVAIDDEIIEIKKDIEKQTAEKLVLQSKIEQLREKVNEYVYNVNLIDEKISALIMNISGLELEKKTLLGKSLGFSNNNINDDIDNSRNESTILTTKIQNHLSLKSLLSILRKKNRIPSLGSTIKWIKNLDARYWLSLLLLFVFGFLSINFVLAFLFDNFQVEYISLVIMNGGVSLGIIQLFRKYKNGILILFFNGILGYFLGLFTLHCYRTAWDFLFCIYQ